MSGRYRVNNWEQQLLIAARARVGEPFAWGTSDCAALVRWAMTLMWGEELWPDLPTWSSVAEAARVVRDHGTVAQLLAVQGYRRVERWHVQTGDIVVDPEAFGGLGSAGIVLNGTHLLSTEEDVGVTIERLEHEWPTGVEIWGWRG